MIKKARIKSAMTKRTKTKLAPSFLLLTINFSRFNFYKNVVNPKIQRKPL